MSEWHKTSGNAVTIGKLKMIERDLRNQFAAPFVEDYARKTLPFLESDVVRELHDEYICKEVLTMLLTDSRVIALSNSDGGDRLFLPDHLLFNWFCRLVVVLSAADLREITLQSLKRQLTNFLGSIGDGDLREIVAFAKRYGFLAEPVISGVFPSPLADLLIHFPADRRGQFLDLLSSLSDVTARTYCLGTIEEIWIQKLLNEFDSRTRYVLRERELPSRSIAPTLEELSSTLNLTRERVRQIEKKGWTKLESSRRLQRIATLGFLSTWMAKGATRLLRRTDFVDIFLTRAAGVPIGRMDVINRVVIGWNSDPLPYREIARRFGEREFDRDSRIREHLIQCDIRYLSKHELQTVHDELIDATSKRPKLAEMALIALRSLGKPSHFREVANEVEAIFPGSAPVGLSIEQALRSFGGGIVWIGMKGMYALEEWGYQRPESDLPTTVFNIVDGCWRASGRPVHFNVINLEVSKRRKMYSENSVRISLARHPQIELLKGQFYKPVDCTKGEKCSGKIEDTLDNLIGGFTATRKNHR